LCEHVHMLYGTFTTELAFEFDTQKRDKWSDDRLRPTYETSLSDEINCIRMPTIS
jgi:hypothetical protein